MKKYIFIIAFTSLFSAFPTASMAEKTGNPLTQDKIQEILTCLGDTTDQEYEWIKDYFLYNVHIDCFGSRRIYKSGRTEYHEFYDIKPIETLSGIAIDSVSTIVDNIKYTRKDALSINPDFVVWIEKTFVDMADSNPNTNEMIEKLYHQNRHVARTFFITYNYLTQEKNFELEMQRYQDAVLEDEKDAILYLKQYTPSQDYDVTTYEYNSKEAQSGYKDNYNRFRFSVGFWLRRGLDGSLSDFVRIMNKLMMKYDNEWYEAHKP